MAKKQEKNAKNVTEYVDQVSGGTTYDVFGAAKRAQQRREGKLTPDVGTWVSYGTAQPGYTDSTRPDDHQIYYPGRENSDFGNVRG